MAFIAVLTFPAPGWGERNPFVLDTLQGEYALNKYLWVWEDSSRQAGFEKVSSPRFDSAFLPFDKVKPLRNRYGVYWAKISIANHLTEPGLVKDWYLWTGDGSFVDVFMAGKDGTLRQHLRTGELVPAREKQLSTFNRVERVPFSMAAGDTVTVFIRLQQLDFHLPVFDLKLTRDNYLTGMNILQKNRTDWFSFGFLAAIAIFSFLLFLSTSDKAFLYHSLFLLSAMLFLLDMMGITPDMLVLRDHPKWAMYLNYVTQACWDVFFLQFFRSYMLLENSLPRWDKILKNLIRWRIVYFIAVFTFFVVTLNEVVADYLSIVYVLAQYFFILGFLAVLYRLRDPKAYFLILATLFFITGVLVNGFLIATGNPINRFFSEGAIVGETLLFSIGLAYRMNQLQEEEKEAQRLKGVDELKNRLYTNITHEFRNPLTVINGMVDQLLAKPTANPQHILQLIRQNSGYLLDLVNRLLNLSKIESGQLYVQKTTGDWVAYLRQLVEFFQPLAAQKSIAIQFLSSLQSLKMPFDAEVVRQIFSNLISNAIKFTPDNGYISVAVELSGEKVTTKVSDTGMGIPEADLPHIFERFYQARNVAHEHGPGTGIGLALTRELILLSGGTIGVQSVEGSGTTFTVTMPVGQPTGDEIEVGQGLQANSPEEWKPEPPPEAEAPLPGLAAPQKDLVLVIEDNPHIVWYLRSLLEDSFEVEAAFNGRDGVEIALETIPDLIVSDVIMPGMDGFAVLETLKKDTRTSHIPIVLLTAMASVKDRIEGLEHGADAYLAKPFEARELLATLNNLLEQRTRLHAFFKKEKTESANAALAIVEDQFLAKAKNAMEANIANEDFGVLQLQRSLALSRTQLHRKLKALTGMSTTEFIHSIRLQKALGLLANPQLNISEVAFEAGFRDPNYFTRLFVKYYGKTPTECRQELAAQR